jgi:hypothetical protein
VETLFITRDIESALRADADVQVGGIPTQRRFSPLINDLGNPIQARTVLGRVASQWSREPHYAAHYARHLLYEQPREIDQAITIPINAAKKEETDAALIHVVGMAYGVRMEQTLTEAKSNDSPLAEVEEQTRADFEEATRNFARSTELKRRERGIVATIQTVTLLVRFSVEIAGATDIAKFLREPARR